MRCQNCMLILNEKTLYWIIAYHVAAGRAVPWLHYTPAIVRELMRRLSTVLAVRWPERSLDNRFLAEVVVTL
jgi:hypothetical protein